MQSIIENAQVKCLEAKKLNDRILNIAVDNVYSALRKGKIPAILERVNLLECRYREVKKNGM